MDDQFKYKQFLLGTLLLVALAVFLNNDDLHADTKNIEILSYGVVSQFPDGLKFEVHVESASLVEEIALRFKVGHQKSGVYEYFKFLNCFVNFHLFHQFHQLNPIDLFDWMFF